MNFPKNDFELIKLIYTVYTKKTPNKYLESIKSFNTLDTKIFPKNYGTGPCEK